MAINYNESSQHQHWYFPNKEAMETQYKQNTEKFDVKVKSMLEYINKERHIQKIEGIDQNIDPESGTVIIPKYKNYYGHFKKTKNTENIMNKSIFKMKDKLNKLFPAKQSLKILMTAITFFRRFYF